MSIQLYVGFVAKFLLTIVLFNFIILTQTASADSFKSGNKFLTDPIYGNLTVNCHDPRFGMRTVNFQCQDLRLAPVEYDYFEGPKVDADFVELVSTFENGKKSKMKSSNYRDGASTDQLNLWISTLFQRPLLNEGKNQVSFKLKKRGTIVHQGQFEVRIDKGPSHRCPNGIINSNQPSDCESAYTICDEYFRQYHFCESESH